MLHGLVPPARATHDDVAAAGLVRVLAVPQGLRELGHDVHRRRKDSAVAALGRPVGRAAGVEPGEDRRVVGHDPREGVVGEAQAGGVRQVTVGLKFGEHNGVVARVDHDADVGVVLGGRPHERRPADVDRVDARLLDERVQVHDNERDRRDVVGGEVGLVGGVRRVGEDSAVHLRVQRDHAMVEDRRVAGHRRQLGHRNSSIGDDGCGAPARHQLPTERVQPGGELDHAGLVEHREEGTPGHRPMLPSTRWTVRVTVNDRCASATRRVDLGYP